MNNYETIEIREAGNKCPEFCDIFDGFGDFNHYVIINMEKEAQYIGRDIIDDLEEGLPHDEALASIETKVKVITKQIQESLEDKVFEYVENNW